MIIHELKIWPDSFLPILKGQKHAEFRKDDRNYCMGDVLHLREWQPEVHYTGRECLLSVSHVLRGPAFGVPDGFAVVSFEVLTISEGLDRIRRPVAGPAEQDKEAVALIRAYEAELDDYANTVTRLHAVVDDDAQTIAQLNEEVQQATDQIVAITAERDALQRQVQQVQAARKEGH